MRAIVSSGKSRRVVELPAWVELHFLLDGAPRANCLRCRKTLSFAGDKYDAERELGRFVLWHRRCPDRTAIEAAVKQAPIDRADTARRDAWFERRRRGG